MAKRYSGNLQINVVYDDKNHYRTSVSHGGKLLWKGIVRPAASGFGPGIAYDSPKAYDEIASTALAFADDEVGGIGDETEFDDQRQGFLIRRAPRSKKSSTSHATRKTAAGWDTIKTISADWIDDAGAAASDLADAIERKFGVERMIEGSWPNYRVLAKGDDKTLEKARAYAAQWLADYEQRAAKKIKITGHATKKRSDDVLTEANYRQAAKFEMGRFGLTLPEALKLVKDKRYPGILKTIEAWRSQHGWPATSSPLSRGYVYELLGMQRQNRGR